jgi:phage-related protein
MANLVFKISPENIIKDFGFFESWSSGSSSAPDGWSMEGSAGSVARESTIKKYGNYAIKIISGSSDQYAAEYAYDITTRKFVTPDQIEVLAESYLPGRTLKLGVWIKCDTASKARIYINDGVARSDSSYHSGGDEWEFLEVEHQVDENLTTLILGIEVASSSVTAYFDGAVLVEGETIFTEFRGNNIYVQEKDFSSQVTFSLQSFTIPRKSGVLVSKSLPKQKKIKLSVQIHNDNVTTARTLFDAIMKAVGIKGNQDLYFWDDRVTVTRIQSVSSLKYLAGARVYKFSISFLAPDVFARYIGMLRQSETIETSPHTFDIEVSGSQPSLPRIEFLPSGSTMEDCTLENLTTGERFSFTSCVISGNTLRIDSDTLEVLNDGIDGQSNFSGDFLELSPGTNHLKFSGSTFLSINIDHFDRWI